MIYTQNQCNFTMSNNKFIDACWINAQISINFEHFSLKCAQPPFTLTSIVNNILNNTVLQTPVLSYIYFTMNFNEDGFQQV